ncbi:hypothetical protein PanWU01x14_007420 [Parasponia andersonii]|uniref:Uncharacterized protein n=1 Tax=Parasponia andersonii TaxID=3476 RepID=A0A2P5E432_PARAD|nr:hypothetical protein PanWU01x14_007420 [Parasponia andersonii]
MGCGESKHDVVTGNTVLHRKQSDNNSSKNSAKDIETAHEKPTAADQHSESAAKDDGDHSAANVKEEDGVGNKTTLLRDDDEKEMLDDHEKEDDVVEAGIGRDSPNHFFSSRKDEEMGIDGIISEGRSGKSEYNTPRHGAGINKDDSVLGPDDQDPKPAVEENNTKEDHDDQEITQEEINAKAANVEENLVKEEVETTKVEKDSKLAEEEKSSTQNQNDEEVV